MLLHNAPQIICFGDSLTWGHFHDGIRFKKQDRWTYHLQAYLGDQYEVIENGLRSRTTNIDDPHRLDRNGFDHLRVCIESSAPDNAYLVYMLGTNDTKTYLNRSVSDIVSGVSESLDWVSEYAHTHKVTITIVLMAPPLLHLNALPETMPFDSSSQTKLQKIAPMLEKNALDNGFLFVDLSDLVASSYDGVHVEPIVNQEIARRVFKVISG